MRKTLLAVAMVGLIALAGMSDEGGGGDRQPKSAAVKRAIAKRDREVKKADAAHAAALADANKALLVELKKAKDAALGAKDLDEANAVAALVARVEREVRAEGGKQARGERLAVDPTEGAWIVPGGYRGTYRKDGAVRFSSWDRDGKWEAVGVQTIVQSEPDGSKTTITFAADGRHALWVLANGRVFTADLEQ